MRTVNVSLPDNLAKQVDVTLLEGEYSSRSELFRTALRIFFVLDKKEEKVGFEYFDKKPINEIRKDLQEAGHNTKFVESVSKGLTKSSLYKNN